jgi:hypothetical protein
MASSGIEVAQERLKRIARSEHSRWHVLPILKAHRDRLVVEVVDTKFRDCSLYFAADYAASAPQDQIASELRCRPNAPLTDEGRHYLESIGKPPHDKICKECE